MDSGIVSVIIFAAGGLLGCAAGFVLAKALRGGDLVSRHELEQMRAQKQELETRLEERADKFKADIQAKQDEIRELQGARERAITLQAEKESLERRIADHKSDLEKMEAKLQLSFESLSNKIFDDKAARFKQQSKESLGELLNPLNDKLTEFRKKIDDSFGDQTKEQFALRKEIERIVEVSDRMKFQTESLVKALRGDSKTQGNWGEIILEKILEDAGLIEGTNYVLQGRDMDLRDGESGRAQRPDAIVTLPDSKTVIVDSKVSLTSYEQYCMEEDDVARAAHLKAFLSSVRNHITELSQKRYQYNEKLETPDFVFMFMPVEGAYALAVQQDSELHRFAWEKKIALVCPSTLFAALRTIASLWRIERQHRNVDEIAKVGGQLYDKIAGFAQDMQNLGRQIQAAGSTYDSALNKLTTGNGNILGRAEKLKKLGAKASKSLPANMVTEDDDEQEESSNIKLFEQN